MLALLTTLAIMFTPHHAPAQLTLVEQSLTIPAVSLTISPNANPLDQSSVER